MEFLAFDPEVDLSIKRRRLPHWHQEGRTYFVTFRLADSLPRKVREAIQEEKREWLQRNGLDNEAKIDSLPEFKQRQFRSQFSSKVEALLDQGLGDCTLGDPENSGIVAEAFQFFDKERYHLDSFVIMPNHVHLLVCPLRPHKLSKLLQSWKRHSAREINRKLNRTGQTFWLDENFDHIVRSWEQLERFRRYIQLNPVRAGLRDREYRLQVCED